MLRKMRQKRIRYILCYIIVPHNTPSPSGWQVSWLKPRILRLDNEQIVNCAQQLFKERKKERKK